MNHDLTLDKLKKIQLFCTNYVTKFTNEEIHQILENQDTANGFKRTIIFLRDILTKEQLDMISVLMDKESMKILKYLVDTEPTEPNRQSDTQDMLY